LRGGPDRQGRQHGEALRERIAQNLAVYDECFAREGIPAEVVQSLSENFLAALAQQSEDYLAGVRGIAEGSGFPLTRIGALNARYEILYYQFGRNALADGCTAFAVAPGRTSNGHLLLGQNWDWLPEVQGAIVQTAEANGLQTLSFTEAGVFGGKIGLSSAGLGLTINGLTTTDDDWSRPSKPFHLRCYEALRSPTLAAASQILLEGERACSANFLLAQVPDQIVDLEVAPRSAQMLRSEEGVLVHTNHFFDPQALGVVETTSERIDCSGHRRDRMRVLLNSRAVLDSSDLASFLRDHDQFPHSICYHVAPGAPPDERYATVASAIMDLTALTLDVADGQPCGAEYRRMGALSRPVRLAQAD
jgi:isopenicillin-N N-acyltransferase-like protein